jgi:hypothetical protein
MRGWIVTNLDNEIRSLAATRHLPNAHLDKWLQLDEASRAAVLELARALKLRTGQIVAALDLLDEISVRENTTIVALLSRPSIRRLLDGAGAAPARGHAVLEELRTMRFPRLRETIQRLEAAVAALRLPPGIKVVLPRELSSDELTIQLTVSDAAGLERLLGMLMEKRGELTRILSMLAGSDEV